MANAPHIPVHSYGMRGGSASQPGHNWVLRANGLIEELGSSARVEMNPGDVFVIETPGGGGYGKK